MCSQPRSELVAGRCSKRKRPNTEGTDRKERRDFLQRRSIFLTNLYAKDKSYVSIVFVIYKSVRLPRAESDIQEKQTMQCNNSTSSNLIVSDRAHCPVHVPGSSMLERTSSGLLPSVLAHTQDLHHTDEDVDEVQLERDGLVYRILGNKSTLSLACMV